MRLTWEIFRASDAGDPYAFRGGTQEYVLRSAGGGASTAVLTWDQALLSDLDGLRTTPRDAELRQRMGERLRRFLAQSDSAEHEAALSSAIERGEPITLTLRLAAAELYALPWELLTLKNTGQHLGELPGALLRYAWPETQSTPPSRAALCQSGRVLFAWSAALGGVPATQHQSAIEDAHVRGYLAFDRSRDVLANASPARLDAALRSAQNDQRPISVLHLLCHGAVAGTAFGLGLSPEEESSGGSPVVVSPAALRQLLAPYANTLRLVVLCACDSANSGALGTQLGSVAQALHRAGIQCVVASRYPLSVLGSVHLTAALYETLLGGPESLEQSFLHARRQLAATGTGLDWASVILFARPEDGDDSRPISLPPYRGLQAFQPQHSRFFFGREMECARALRSLQSLQNTGRPRCLLVSGASGTGKSSVVLAGLLPALTADRGDAKASDSAAFRAVTTAADDREQARQAIEQLWRLLSHYAHRPTLQQALAAMAGELESLPLVGAAGWDFAVLRPGRDPNAALQQALAQRSSPDRPFLLVVDQLEEIFTYALDATVRQAFVARLWQLCQGETGISCILTLRVDLLGRCGELILDESGLRLDRVAYDDAHRVFVAQMQPTALRAAILAPAHRVGLELEDALAQRILADVEGEPGALPLLEHVLDLLWQRREGRILTAQSYADLGGVAGALESSAERAYAALSEVDQGLTRRLFASLIAIPEEGGEIARRRAPMQELHARDPDRISHIDAVIDAFVDARLLVRGDDQGAAYVEVAHEALLRKWPRLRGWLREDRERLGEIQELDRWARQWVRYQTPLRGSQLGYAANVLEKFRGDLSPTIRHMIGASQGAARRRTTLAALGVVSVIGALSTLSAVAYTHQRSAEQQARVALSRLLADQAQVQIGPSPDVALLLAARALQLNDEPESRSAMLAAMESTRPLRFFLRGPSGRIASVAFSPDGRMLAAADSQGALWLFDPRSAQTLGQLTQPLSNPASTATPVLTNALAFRPDGLLLAAGRSDGHITLWDPLHRVPQGAPLVNEARAIYSLDFSADGQLLAAGGEEGRIWLWDITKRSAPTTTLSGHTQAITSLTFGRAGARMLASGSGDSSARLWDIDGITPRREPLNAHQEYVSSVAFSPDGALLATASADHTLQLWDAATGQRHGSALRQHTDGVSGVAFEPNGRVLVSCGLDHQVMLWDPANGERIGRPLQLPTGPIQSCALSPDGRLLAAAGEGVIALVDLAGHSALRRQDERYRLQVAALGLSPDGQTLAIGDATGVLRFWDVRREQPIGDALPVHRGAINGVSFSPDGKTVASCSSDHTVALVDVSSQSRLGILPTVHTSAVTAIAYSPRGDLIATSSADSSVIWWDTTTRQPRAPALRTRQLSATALAYRPDGSELAVGGLDGTIQLLNPATGTGRCAALAGHTDAITSLAYNPHAPMLASGSRDHGVRLWNLNGCPAGSGELLQKHAVAVTAVAFRSDGQVLASGDQDADIWLWDLPIRQAQRVALREHRRPINALLFAPGGVLLSGDDDLLWPWRTAPDVQQACARANRNLSLAEWRRYVGSSPYCRVCTTHGGDDAAESAAPACGTSGG